jgi:hypothetical protein
MKRFNKIGSVAQALVVTLLFFAAIAVAENLSAIILAM